jgi:microcystin-dependent protein
MPITISPTTLSQGIKGSPYEQVFTAAGGTGPYTWSVVSGTLPPGLNLDGSDGDISGTPTQVGTHSFTIRATDSLAATGDQALTLDVTGAVYWFICTSAAYPPAVPAIAGTQHAFNRGAANAIAGLSKTRHQPGDLLARPNSDAVSSHLLCDGSAVSRVAFPQLFEAIGTEWGAGDGSTTFNIPRIVGSLPITAVTPTQTISDSTVSTGGTVTEPSAPGETGGSTGGNYSSGGRPQFNDGGTP